MPSISVQKNDQGLFISDILPSATLLMTSSFTMATKVPVFPPKVFDKHAASSLVEKHGASSLVELYCDNNADIKLFTPMSERNINMMKTRRARLN